MARNAVETESKHKVEDLPLLLSRLRELGYTGAAAELHVDEYFDSRDDRLAKDGLVVRLRTVAGSTFVAFKGPIKYNADGTYTRSEVELPSALPELVRASLADQRIVRVRRLEKRRREFRHNGAVVVTVDELPYVGYFVELEGDADEISSTRMRLADALGPAECRNSFELTADYLRDRGVDVAGLQDVSFAQAETSPPHEVSEGAVPSSRR